MVSIEMWPVVQPEWSGPVALQRPEHYYFRAAEGAPRRHDACTGGVRLTRGFRRARSQVWQDRFTTQFIHPS
jgi:hypothetical protein